MIAVDWGSSSLRCYRLDDRAGASRDGASAAGGTGSGAADTAWPIVDERSQSIGLLDCQGRFAAVLAKAIAGWDDERIVCAGMVGSRNGWVEVPYVDAPAGAATLAAGVRELTTEAKGTGLAGRRVAIAPGLVWRPGGGLAPEVMRGEETQVLGLLASLGSLGTLGQGAAGDGRWICLPGTHSKWVRVEAGRITRLHTAMTGEVFAVMRRHSLLGALMPPADGTKAATPGEPPAAAPAGPSTTGALAAAGPTADADANDAAFDLGLATARQPGGLPTHLFSVRTRGLLGELAPTQLPDYLSGLLIGHELIGLLDDTAGRSGAGAPVHLVGAPQLTRRYERALRQRGLAVVVHDGALTARGLQVLAQARA